MDQRRLTTRWTPADYRQRPVEYDPAMADMIVERLANGEMLSQVCAADRDLPLPGTFLRWVDEDPSLEERYLRARRYGAEVNLDEAVISANTSDPATAGVKSRALMWHVERSVPEKYGPRTRINLSETKEKDVAGIDYAAEVRRRLDAMSARAVSDGDSPAGA